MSACGDRFPDMAKRVRQVTGADISGKPLSIPVYIFLVCCLQVWSARTGLLVCTCRGHMQEISDLSVNMDSTLFASASVDGVIRVWTLSGATAIGAPVAVLKAHTSIVTAIDFSPVHPNVLLSSSYDGTCRVWNVRDAAMPPVVVQWASPVPPPGGTPWWAGTADGHRTTRLAERRAMGDGHNGSNGAQHGHAQQRDERSRRGAPEAGPSAGQGAIIDLVGDEHEGGEGGEGQDEDGGPVKFGTASFSRTGEYIFAGAKDCCTYVWHWPGTGKEEVATSSADPAWPQATVRLFAALHA